MRRIVLKTGAFLTAAALLLGSAVRAAAEEKPPLAADAVYKQETVHVTADPLGTPEEVEVEVILRGDGTARLPDRTNLTDIRNTEGDETYLKAADGSLRWENKGEDIHYKGNGNSDDLPLELTVSYILDGNLYSPQGLAGKSGHLTMRFDYKNKLTQTVEQGGKTQTVPVPLTAMTIVPLDEDVFSNVKVKNGKVMTLDDSGMAVGMVFPGMAAALDLGRLSYTEDIEIPEYFEITADVVNFSLDFTATMVSAGLLDDMDEEDLTVDENFDGTAADIDSAIDQMYEGADGLKNAVDQFAEGVGAMLRALKTAVEDLTAQGKNLGKLWAQFLVPEDDPETPQDESLLTLAGQIEAARKAAEAAGDDQALEYLKNAQKMIEELLDETDGLLTKILEENVVAEAYVSGTAEGAEQLKGALDKMQEAVTQFRNGINSFRDNGSGELKKLARDADKMRTIMDTLKAMRRAGLGYTSFTGLPEGKTGSVSFLYETGEIKEK